MCGSVETCLRLEWSFALLRAAEISPGQARLRAPPWVDQIDARGCPEGARESVFPKNADVLIRSRFVELVQGIPIWWATVPRGALEEKLALGWSVKPILGKNHLRRRSHQARVMPPVSSTRIALKTRNTGERKRTPVALNPAF